MWIVPKTLSAFVPDTEGLNLGLDERAWMLEQSAMWRSKPSSKQTWLRRLKKGGWITHLSTRILKPSQQKYFEEKFTALTCGYPCQPFSSAGKRKGEEDPRHLWPYIRRHVRAIGPSWVLAENVRGHTTMGLWRVLSDLEEDGYRTEWGLFSAEETGAPHQRIRVFILAYPHLRRDHKGTAQTLDRKSKGYRGDDLLPKRHQVGAELAHTASREPRQSQARNGGQDIGGGSEEESLARKAQGEAASTSGRGKPRGGSWPTARSSDAEGGRIKTERTEKGFRSKREKSDQYFGANTEGCSGDGETTHAEAQSELVRAVDGLTHRVDRLRLLGNGVVPQTAEIAWKTLWRKMNEDNH